MCPAGHFIFSIQIRFRPPLFGIDNTCVLLHLVVHSSTCCFNFAPPNSTEKMADFKLSVGGHRLCSEAPPLGEQLSHISKPKAPTNKFEFTCEDSISSPSLVGCDVKLLISLWTLTLGIGRIKRQQKALVSCW